MAAFPPRRFAVARRRAPATSKRSCGQPARPSHSSLPVSFSGRSWPLPVLSLDPGTLRNDMPFRAVAVQATAAEGSVYLLAPEADEWVKLSGTAGRIWEALEYPATVDGIAA